MEAALHKIEREFAADGDSAELHVVKFERNRNDGRWRAMCSCMWACVGTEAEVKTRAAGHDLEWERMP